MRLVRLEIKGFKSFAKETVLHFNEDVIGVVGPNGSGKSNIVDAIRWVLGEQKKGELRLDKMSSVIFNGTKNRKPSNVAQVFLTFDNDRGVLKTDFQTITIGRLLYRNGDSEYRLNGVPCRKKDITDLFVDTGIESNSYSIIALGMVDDILADNDNSRLRMLEQAAGTSVYKLRKKEALSRLDRTQEDLDRVQDLLFEIDGQLSSLEKQAKRTKKYFELKSAYREMSLDYAYVSSKSIKEQSQQVSSELERAEQLTASKNSLVEELEAKIEQTRSDQLTEEKHLVEQRRQMGIIQSKLRAAINDRQLAEQKRAYLSQNREKLTSQGDKLQLEIARLTENADRYSQRLHTARQESNDFIGSFEQSKNDYELEQGRVEELRSALRQHIEQAQKLERQLAELDRNITIAQSRIESLQQESAARARRAEQEITKQAEAEQRDQELRTRVEKLRLQLQAAENLESRRAVDEERIRNQLDELAPKLRQLRSDQQRAENEATLLRSMLDNLEGSSDSVKFLANKQGWKDRYDLLGDVLDIDEAYRPAIEALLGEYLQCYLVPDAATAAEGMRVLAEAKQSPVRILFTEGIESLEGLSAKPPTSARPAVEVVRVPKKYAPLLQILLSGCGINPESIQPIELDDSQTVVSLNGAQLWNRFSAKGGATSKLLGHQTGRRQQLIQLEARIDSLCAEASTLDALRINYERDLQLTRHAATTQEIKVLRQRVGECERESAGAQAKLESFDAQKEVREKIDHETGLRLKTLETELATLNVQRKPIAEAYELAKSDQENRDAASEQAADRMASASAAYNSANLNSIKLQNQIAAIERELTFAQDQLKELLKAKVESERALNSDGSDLALAEEQILELTLRIEQGELTRQEHHNRLTKREEDFLALRNQLVDWEKLTRQSQRELNDALSLVSRLRERKSELGFRIESLTERLKMEFNLDLSTAIQEKREVTATLAEMESQLGRQKAKLDDYGAINPLAVEAFDTLSERKQGIDSQRSDILAAMDDLRETVSEIDRTATEQLQTAFEAVRGHFIDVFRHLFDAEDTADMIMVDPDNPLESKIEIIAKPKGKRPQTINQLSGGEKTLTATAFLFALYLIKPAPFCIFDEVDAPLDDSNVEKFNRIIKRFSKGSQFIIVTHNKLTMAAVDTIYGVYMPELGVSQVAPVDFREFEHKEVLEMVG